jgi:hypothetical protein
MNRGILIGALALLVAACGEPATDVSAPRLQPGAATAAVLSPSDGKVVMKGLDNPRGLTFGPDGLLYVAEAGRGGDGPCFQNGGTVCYGPSGRISRLRDTTTEHVVTGLPSYANVASGRAEGPNSISFHSYGGAYVTIGLEADPNIRTGELQGLGRLVQIFPATLHPGRGRGPAHDTWEFVADLGAYEIATNPDCGRIDSNPFAVLAEPGGVIVADAGANTLVRRAANGDLSVFASFTSRYTLPLHDGCPTSLDGPNTPVRETVPTSIAVGPDGAYYVGQLAGLPLVQGAANVYRVVPGQAPEIYLLGFTWIVSLAFDPAGNLYVLQHAAGTNAASNGSLIRVSPDGLTRTTVLANLVRPTSVAIGPDGAIYISHRGISIDKGEVLRFDP